jgi:hypothetical protein
VVTGVTVLLLRLRVLLSLVPEVEAVLLTRLLVQGALEEEAQGHLVGQAQLLGIRTQVEGEADAGQKPVDTFQAQAVPVLLFSLLTRWLMSHFLVSHRPTQLLPIKRFSLLQIQTQERR